MSIGQIMEHVATLMILIWFIGFAVVLLSKESPPRRRR